MLGTVQLVTEAMTCPNKDAHKELFDIGVDLAGYGMSESCGNVVAAHWPRLRETFIDNMSSGSPFLCGYSKIYDWSIYAATLATEVRLYYYYIIELYERDYRLPQAGALSKHYLDAPRAGGWCSVYKNARLDQFLWTDPDWVRSKQVGDHDHLLEVTAHPALVPITGTYKVGDVHVAPTSREVTFPWRPWSK